MKKHSVSISLIACVAFFAACTGDYSFGDQKYTRKVVVESLINPDSTLKVAVYWTSPPDSEADYELIDDAFVEIAEDGNIIFSEQSIAGIAEANVYPSAGKSYTLKVEVPGQPIITASTSIPQPANISFSLREKFADIYNEGYIAVDVDNISAPEGCRAVWLAAEAEYDSGKIDSYYGDFYSTCPFLDQVNCTTDPMDALLRESNIIYEGDFIRIQRALVNLAVPFTFSYSLWWDYREYEYDEDDWFEPPIVTEFYAKNALVYITVPSDEYDRFRRSAYQQPKSWLGDSPLISEQVSVFSNIENGIGIFAGYNTTVVAKPINNPVKQ